MRRFTVKQNYIGLDQPVHTDRQVDILILFYKDLAVEASMFLYSSIVKRIFALLPSIKIKYTWNKIINKQVTERPLMTSLIK